MDFPDPDEEFELMHADDMEIMDEMGFGNINLYFMEMLFTNVLPNKLG